jgi:hypothetical protein
MLYRLLQIACSAGVHSLRQLAEQLDVSEALLESMIDQLVQMGCLKTLDGARADSCSGCPTGSACSTGSLGRVWVLTEAGYKIVRSEAS